jgi:hypothetical protein
MTNIEETQVEYLRYGKYRRKWWTDMEIMEERQVEW